METAGFTLDELKRQDPERYFQEVLYVSEFNELRTLVKDSIGKISWSELIQEGVVKIEGKKVEGIYWIGALNLEGTQIKTLWKIKKIGRNLNCKGLEILEALGELEEVGGYLDLINTKIKSLGKLKYVGKNLRCAWVRTLEDLGNLEEVGGILDISWTRIKSLGKLKKIGRNLYCESLRTLKDLGELEEIGKWVDFRETSIKSLGNLKKVGNVLNCNGFKILEDIGELEEVGFLDIEGTSFECQKQVIKRIKKGKLLINGRLKPYENLSQIYRKGKIDYKEFKGIYGKNIKEIKDEEIKEQAKAILVIEYEIIKEELIERGNKIREENEGKKLIEDKKTQLRKQIKKLGNRLKIEKEKIESFGVKL